MKRAIVIEVISGLFILLFVYAAVSKLLDTEKFMVQIGQSPMLTGVAGILAWFVPSLELLISFLLVLQPTRLIGFVMSFTLMVIFTAYIIIITNYSHYVPCSCGGILQTMTWRQHLMFNIFFVLLALIAIVLIVRGADNDSHELQPTRNI